MDGRRRKKGRLQRDKERLAELLHIFQREGIAIPLVSEPSRKAYRSRGAGAAQDKKRERKATEAEIVGRRIVELETALKERGVEIKEAESESSESS
jgi:hypothetical protein